MGLLMLTSPATRCALMFILVGCFVGQTSLVYLDDSGLKTPPLSEKAQLGWKVWHQHNCQACHQIYGYGGFLGPDLTNAAGNLTPERLQSILTEGSNPMPAFHLNPEEIEGIKSFLRELDATGQGQLRLSRVPAPDAILDEVVAATADTSPLSEDAVLGREFIRRQQCLNCHLPNALSSHRANDLTLAVDRLGVDGVVTTLRNGRPGTPMPAFSPTLGEEKGLKAFFLWLQSHRKAVRQSFETAQKAAGKTEVPWFNYEK